MPVQILTIKLDGITAGDYLTWCRAPDPPALDYGFRSVRVGADLLADTIAATLDWDRSAPGPAIAAAAGLPLSPGVQIQPPAITNAASPARYAASAGCTSRASRSSAIRSAPPANSVSVALANTRPHRPRPSTPTEASTRLQLPAGCS